MRKSFIRSIFALTTLALAACGQSSSDGAGGAGKSVDPAKAAAEIAFQFQPGQYRTTVDFTKVEMPGLPPSMARQMKQMMAQKTTSDSCISPERAARGMDVMKEQLGKGKCQFEKFQASGGTVDSVFTCQTGQGMNLRAASKGTYGPTGSKVAVTSDMTMPGGKSMHIEQTVTMERIGDCS